MFKESTDNVFDVKLSGNKLIQLLSSMSGLSKLFVYWDANNSNIKCTCK